MVIVNNFFFFKLYFLFTVILSISSRIIQKDSKFYDENGRHRIFHGVNIVYKTFPYIPSNDTFDPFLSFNNQDIAYMKKFGFNLVRLGVMWESIETSPSVYNYDLLNKYENLVNLLGENGIYTIIDSHQDLISRKFCGEGFPLFIVENSNYENNCQGSLFKRFLNMIGVCKSFKEYNIREDINGLPLIEDCLKTLFSLFNATPEVTSFIKKFFENENGILDKYIDFWKILANKFKNNKYVLGYDLWNEPFPGGLYDNPFQKIQPGYCDQNQLLPLYRKIDESLRKIDNDYIMMFEPNIFPDTLPLLFWRFRGTFTDLPIQDKGKQMYNYHSYCCSSSISMCSKGEPPLESAKECKAYHIENVNEANKYTSKHGIGSIITEFGACFNTESCYNEISSLSDAADQYLTSWAYWMYKPFNDFTTSCIDNQEGLFDADGSLQEFKVKGLTRTYVQAFQGEGIYMNFNKETKNFQTKFKLNKTLDSPTVIYFNKELNYRNGYNILTSRKSFIDDSEENLLKIKIIDEDSSQNEEITILLINTTEEEKIKEKINLK